MFLEFSPVDRAEIFHLKRQQNQVSLANGSFEGTLTYETNRKMWYDLLIFFFLISYFKYTMAFTCN